MGSGAGPVRAVLDTNVLVSALLFEGRLTWVRDAWKDGRLKPLISQATLDELIRVLAYPKFRLEPEEIEVFLEELLPHAESIEVPPQPDPPVLRCTDPEDQKFIALAEAGAADFLVSGDPDLLELAPEAPIRIVPPAKLRELIT